VFVAFDADILWRRSPKRVSVVELSTAERVSERGIGFDGRTRERTGNFCWDPSWRGEDGARLPNATSGVEGAGRRDRFPSSPSSFLLLVFFPYASILN
jgi:hypothetical protein